MSSLGRSLTAHMWLGDGDGLSLVPRGGWKLHVCSSHWGRGGGEGGCVLDDLVTFELLTKYFTIAF